MTLTRNTHFLATFICARQARMLPLLSSTPPPDGRACLSKSVTPGTYSMSKSVRAAANDMASRWSVLEGRLIAYIFWNLLALSDVDEETLEQTLPTPKVLFLTSSCRSGRQPSVPSTRRLLRCWKIMYNRKAVVAADTTTPRKLALRGVAANITVLSRFKTRSTYLPTKRWKLSPFHDGRQAIYSLARQWLVNECSVEVSPATSTKVRMEYMHVEGKA